MRSRSLFRSAVGAVALAVSLLAPTAGATARPAGPTLTLQRSGVLHAGDEVVLRWNGTVEASDELEIMLTVESPARRTIQISPQLDPARGAFVWKVPDLDGAWGRFRVRFERDGHEVEGLPSAPVHLLPAESPALDPALAAELPVSGGVPEGPLGAEKRMSAALSETRTLARACARAASRRDAGVVTPAPRVCVRALGAADATVPRVVPLRN